MSEAIAVANHEDHPGRPRAVAGPERLLLFLKDVRQEMHKVIAPSKAEVRSTTLVVIVTVFIFAAYFELVDLVFGKGIDQVFSHLTRH